MSSTPFTEAIQLKNNTVLMAQWVEKYPASALVQMMYYVALDNPTTHDLNKVALYKSHPYLFAKYIREPKNKANNNIETKQSVTIDTPPIATNTSDILSEINALEDVKFKEVYTVVPKPIETTTQSFTDIQTSDTTISTDQSLMQMMSFTDWLNYFKKKKQEQEQEDASKNQLVAYIQKEKLSAAQEEDSDVIPEPIFTQAMNSITDNEITTESLAEILEKQGKYSKAIEMYKKLSLLYPEKSPYFAKKIKELLFKLN